MISKIMALILQHQRIFVYRHVNPDFDAIGTQSALTAMLRLSFPEKQVIAVGLPKPSLAWISEDMTVEKLPSTVDLTIVVDCANRARIAGPLPVSPTVKIDHHPDLDPYAQLNWVEPQMASCAEMIYKLYQTYPERLKINADIAGKLYAGIIGDTVNFSTTDTTSQTFDVASKLYQLGIDGAKISQQVTAVDLKLSKLMGFVFENIKINQRGLATLVIPQALLRRLQIPWGSEDSIVALPARLKEVKIWLLFIESPEGQYRVHLRSKFVPINAVAQQFGGGGHLLASGTYVKNLQVGEQLIAATNRLLVM
ncbi:DHH family phosphoesterase [Pediococcus cellicola]|uniref:Exopolyphosphatase-related protein n=1 Tax=Pediococcus cellicola TaxID=319652 RepID=A0A0R2IYR9_9LACO|nr:bifunctional oligoribonuclease/PAP phosphatase NrnA [Pediococcus cellicola]KRN66797.1 exopolyphosphatase-related protein [Pediococcus cellicola]GEL14558.1 phosphoesterase [Pediococcus cellicola]